MNSDSGALPSVLSGVSKLATPLSSSIPPQTQQDSHASQHAFIRPQGHVYSLSGHVERPSGLGQHSHNSRKTVPNGPYAVALSQQPGKLKRLRLLPYQECHRTRFLCLEQDTELLMQMLQAQIQKR